MDLSWPSQIWAPQFNKVLFGDFTQTVIYEKSQEGGAQTWENVASWEEMRDAAEEASEGKV